MQFYLFRTTSRCRKGPLRVLRKLFWFLKVGYHTSYDLVHCWCPKEAKGQCSWEARNFPCAHKGESLANKVLSHGQLSWAAWETWEMKEDRYGCVHTAKRYPQCESRGPGTGCPRKQSSNLFPQQRMGYFKSYSLKRNPVPHSESFCCCTEKSESTSADVTNVIKIEGFLGKIHKVPQCILHSI